MGVAGIWTDGGAARQEMGLDSTEIVNVFLARFTTKANVAASFRVVFSLTAAFPYTVTGLFQAVNLQEMKDE